MDGHVRGQVLIDHINQRREWGDSKPLKTCKSICVCHWMYDHTIYPIYALPLFDQKALNLNKEP